MSEPSQDPPVRVHRDGAIAVVTLNRPDRRNALTTELLETLRDALQQLDTDPSVRAVVLTGGTRTFASGADVRELRSLRTADYLTSPRLVAWRAVMSVRTPLVAAVAGPVLGGGCELALCADLVVAADDAVFGQPEIRLGIIPGAGGTQRWARVIGWGRPWTPGGPGSSGSCTGCVPGNGWWRRARRWRGNSPGTPRSR